MKLRFAEEKDYLQLAEMRWLHCEEEDIDYHEHNLKGVNKEAFIAAFTAFLHGHPEYKIFIADDNGVVACAMFAYMIPKIPRPNGTARYIAYLTNVFTRKEYRNQRIGTGLLNHIKKYLADAACELIFAWPSEKSVKWYSRNGFCQENEVFECDLDRQS